MKKICNVEGCENKVRSRGFCITHYTRFLKYGDPLGKKEIRKPREFNKKFCSVAGCEKKHYARELCRLHYGRFMRNGTVELKKREWEPTPDKKADKQKIINPPTNIDKRILKRKIAEEKFIKNYNYSPAEKRYFGIE